ncbi:SUMF1/EgtB/PvdO family nonheme iron enzyme [Bradyrhizobium sp. SSUT77]|uniref:SUMF1/EgtB/PvdO family nonheme iron enzyme n=1 Tax=Bradyrhizobium sp. SSUT77 TaxID=3040603 RepID=UPI00244708F6|nr:SUMF1/EgtB/PvdO family nonheme iron enzyme [Bradyrhizobium sp. SSUT77]MDH2347167.1 SUMF1/EgtB/PvdO family nonheme iron enzyme [Bradyrhizobium sp. SSUT77]
MPLRFAADWLPSSPARRRARRSCHSLAPPTPRRTRSRPLRCRIFSRSSTGCAPQAGGAFGTNSKELDDLGGNAREWTETCTALHDGRITNPNCGVRVVEGAHRAYMTDFIRDAKTGAARWAFRPQSWLPARHRAIGARRCRHCPQHLHLAREKPIQHRSNCARARSFSHDAGKQSGSEGDRECDPIWRNRTDKTGFPATPATRPHRISRRRSVKATTEAG